MEKKICTFILGCLALLSINGCTKAVTRHPGIISTKVFGTLQLEVKSTDSKPFVLVVEHNQTFLRIGGKSLTKVAARIVHPDENGNYQVRFLNNVVRLDLTFISRNHYLGSSQFDRTLGIGAFEYSPVLKKDPLWQENFEYSIKPILSEYIIEKRFNLPDRDQYFLGQWLNYPDPIPQY